MAGLEQYLEETAGSAVWVAGNARFTNNVGTPVVSVTAADAGEAIAGVYNLTFSSVVAATSADVTVTCVSPSNPYNTSGSRPAVTVALDNSTGHELVVGGVTIKFSDSVSFSNLWTAQIRIGFNDGNLPSFPPSAGTPGTERQVRAVNTGDDIAQSCQALLLPRAVYYRITGKIFAALVPFAETATEKETAGVIQPYVFTVSNVLGSGASKTMDVRVDGLAVDLENQTDLTVATSDDVNVVDYFKINTGDEPEGLIFKLSEDAVNSDEANVLIYPIRFHQIAPDVDGEPGTWGTDPVDLTEDGQSTGIISASAFGLYWRRSLIPVGGTSKSNPHPMDECLQGAAGAAANWSGPPV